MSHQAFVLTRNNHEKANERDEANERFLRILPSCGFAVTEGAIQPPRSILNNTHTFFIDANYCSTTTILKVLSKLNANFRTC